VICVLNVAALHPDALQRHTPTDFADKIRQSRAALAGECKQVTVLLTDEPGSMELLASSKV
jgi:hypothetical protein